jgi:hypothetical protein
MLYMLQSNGDRSVIHTELVTEKRLLDGVLVDAYFEQRGKPVEANSWLEAKKKFGFELTPEQQRLLAA